MAHFYGVLGGHARDFGQKVEDDLKPIKINS